MIQNVKFEAFSVKSKVTRDKTSYLNIKRLFLRIEQDKILNFVFNHKQAESPFYFALRYFDLESEVWSCFHYHGYADITIDRDFVDSLTNFFCSLYEHDRSYFQTFFGLLARQIVQNRCCRCHGICNIKIKTSRHETLSKSCITIN